MATVRVNATRRVCLYGRDPAVEKLPVMTFRGKECPQHGTPSLRVENHTWYLKFKEPPMPGVSRYHPKNERGKRPNDLCTCHVSHTRYLVSFSQPRCPLCQLQYCNNPYWCSAELACESNFSNRKQQVSQPQKKRSSSTL